jgi:hypothetical protein
MTVLSLLALRSLGFTAYLFGMLLAVFGTFGMELITIEDMCPRGPVAARRR